MCGIIGKVGVGNVFPELLNGFEKFGESVTVERRLKKMHGYVIIN